MESITTAFTSAFTDVTTNVTSIISGLVPGAVGLAAVGLAVMIGFKYFKRLANKA